MIEPGEQVLAIGPGLDPPSQPELEGVPPVVAVAGEDPWASIRNDPAAVAKARGDALDAAERALLERRGQRRLVD